MPSLYPETSNPVFGLLAADAPQRAANLDKCPISPSPHINTKCISEPRSDAPKQSRKLALNFQ